MGERLSLVTCKQTADHFTPIMWFDFISWRFHFIKGRFHHSNCIKYNQNDVTQNCISSETPNWYMCATWEIKTQIYGLHICLPKEKWGQIFLLVFAPMCFLWNNLWSVSRYVMEAGWEGPSLSLTAPIWECRSRIGDYRFTFFMDLLPNYTFYTNLTILFIGYLLIEDGANLITFNSSSLKVLDSSRKIQNDVPFDTYYRKPELISWR